ncbi:hypothetical protein G4D82_10160 [Flavobacterium sp. CYK-4]|uniref:hypothetical protein n=1 Tax=Flavobacterium lotistagni TaxID=2709660 RepID=UPI001407B114|nr:hypothetical protein [Flavobacterium lotistagni]NHM07585.1 hypothetical protein [Flavobacterium lotistagni]
MKQLILFVLIWLTAMGCSRKIITKNQYKLSAIDSAVIQQYKYKLIRNYEEDSTSTEAQLDSLWKNEAQYQVGFVNSEVHYAPDGRFKIFSIEVESCGGYCNSEWFSWIHHLNSKNETVQKASFKQIDTIVKLHRNQYLIIDQYSARPASVLTVSCQSARWFTLSDTLIENKIHYRGEDNFSFCQQNGVALENERPPYVKYEKGFLKYYYGNNYSYSHDRDIDTIRKGQFKYRNGKFILEHESIQVNHREPKKH